jgi:hypothetical protein
MLSPIANERNTQILDCRKDQQSDGPVNYSASLRLAGRGVERRVPL